MKRLCLLWLFLLGKSAFAQDTTFVELVFAGDIMQHQTQIESAYDSASGSYNYSGVFQQMKPALQAADLAIGNLEFTFGGKPYTGYPQFSAPDEFLPAIIDAGFDLVVTANNHSVDRGKKGLERTIRMLDSLGLAHTGTFADTVDRLNDYPLILERNGIRLALLNYTYGTNGISVKPPNVVNMIDTVRILEDLELARKREPDALIVFFHWGDEYKFQPQESQRTLARFCLANGVKLVIGSHPHVLQPMVWDKEKDQAVVYSLGNFISGQRVRYRNGGALAHVRIRKISDPAGQSRTQLDDVSYSLSWVHRQRKAFRILPVTSLSDTININGTASRKLMAEFINDSRAFLDKENREVNERARRSKDK